MVGGGDTACGHGDSVIIWGMGWDGMGWKGKKSGAERKRVSKRVCSVVCSKQKHV